MVEGHHQVSLGEQIGEIVSKTLLAAVYGICIGLAMGIFNRLGTRRSIQQLEGPRAAASTLDPSYCPLVIRGEGMLRIYDDARDFGVLTTGYACLLSTFLQNHLLVAAAPQHAPQG